MPKKAKQRIFTIFINILTQNIKEIFRHCSAQTKKTNKRFYKQKLLIIQKLMKYHKG